MKTNKKISSRQIKYYMCPYCKWGTRNLKNMIGHIEVLHAEEIRNNEIEIIEINPNSSRIIKIPLMGKLWDT